MLPDYFNSLAMLLDYFLVIACASIAGLFLLYEGSSDRYYIGYVGEYGVSYYAIFFFL